jgi:hypothetical protein
MIYQQPKPTTAVTQGKEEDQEKDEFTVKETCSKKTLSNHR